MARPGINSKSLENLFISRVSLMHEPAKRKRATIIKTDETRLNMNGKIKAWNIVRDNYTKSFPFHQQSDCTYLHLSYSQLKMPFYLQEGNHFAISRID